MSFTFRTGVHAVRTGGQIILLDERSSRYHALTARQEEALLSDEGADRAGQDVLGPLHRRGLLIPADRFSAELFPACPPPSASLLEDDGPQSLRPGDLAWSLLAFRRAEQHIAKKRLGGVLAMQRQAIAAQSEQGPVEALARRFLSSRLWMPWTPICFLDSVALLRFLGFRGLDAQLVVGVRVTPFEAHCWVERNSVALNETVLRARSFTPIVIA